MFHPNDHQTHIIDIARYVWDADAFLKQPHVLLEGKTPLDVSATAEGTEQVEVLLRELFWGLLL